MYDRPLAGKEGVMGPSEVYTLLKGMLIGDKVNFWTKTGNTKFVLATIQPLGFFRVSSTEGLMVYTSISGGFTDAQIRELAAEISEKLSGIFLIPLEAEEA